MIIMIIMIIINNVKEKKVISKKVIKSIENENNIERIMERVE